MENVYFEDDAGVSPQWLAVRVRLQSGLILAYRDSLLCSRLPLQASFAPVPAKQGIAICFLSLRTITPADCLVAVTVFFTAIFTYY